jgi:DNA-directed RNA polymerase sigma subunit (sigma70/sigma32)
VKREPSTEEIHSALIECSGGAFEKCDLIRVRHDDLLILYYRFVEGMTLEEIGRVVRNIQNDSPATRERIRQRLVKSLRKIHTVMKLNDDMPEWWRRVTTQ